MSEVCSHRFRSREDVSQYLLREWQKLEGNFYPVNACRFCRYYDLSDQNTSLLHVIEKKKARLSASMIPRRWRRMTGSRGN